MSESNITMKNFSTQILPILQEFLIKLNSTGIYLQQLGIELLHNPSMLIRGKYPYPLGPEKR